MFYKGSFLNGWILSFFEIVKLFCQSPINEHINKALYFYFCVSIFLGYIHWKGITEPMEGASLSTQVNITKSLSTEFVQILTSASNFLEKTIKLLPPQKIFFKKCFAILVGE